MHWVQIAHDQHRAADRSMNTRRFLLRAMILAGLLSALASCAQAAPPQAAKTPTVASSTLTPTAIATLQPTPTLWGGQSATLGPVPQNCPASLAPKKVPVFGLEYCASPLWVYFSGPSTHTTLVWSPNDAFMYHDQYGWAHKFLWLIEARYTGIVTIHGANVDDGSPLLPDADHQTGTSTLTSLVLDTQDPTIINRTEQWTEVPGGLTIPKAGCYYLEADWPGGHWRIIFAAGEVPSY